MSSGFDGVSAISLDATFTLFRPRQPAALCAEVLVRHGVRLEVSSLAPMLREVWREMACQGRMGEDRFAAHPGGARGFWRRFLSRLLERLGVDAVPPFAASELFERFCQADAWEVYPEVAEVLRLLRAKGTPLAIISNWDERLPRVLDALGLLRAVDHVIFSQSVGVEKPHPGIFEEALRRLGLPPSSVLHVGDRPIEDREGAQAAGLRALLLDRDGNRGDLQDLRPLIRQETENRRGFSCVSLPSEDDEDLHQG